MAKKIPVTMKMDPDLKAEAETFAKQDSRSFANFVEASMRLMIEHLKRRERTSAKPKP